MTLERQPDDADPAALSAWLDGLSGQPGTGQAHDEGSRLRQALAPDAGDVPRSSWQDIESRARRGAPSTVLSSGVAAPVVVATSSRQAAANQPRRWSALSWAALLMLVVGLVSWMSPPAPAPHEGLRGADGAQALGARWLTDQPLRDAESLAAELRSLGADVALSTDAGAIQLRIQAPPAAAAAVNARLAAFETGLDAQGRLTLSVASRP